MGSLFPVPGHDVVNVMIDGCLIAGSPKSALAWAAVPRLCGDQKHDHPRVEQLGVRTFQSGSRPASIMSRWTM